MKLWKLHIYIYITSRSEYLSKVKWNVTRRVCYIFSPHRPFTKLLLARGIISASIFSENVEGMNLKFAEEME